MTQTRITWGAVRAALSALVMLGATVPAWAAATPLQSPQQDRTAEAAAVGFAEPDWAGPTLHLLSGDTLEVSGERGGRVLLLYGSLQPGSEYDGRRVDPRWVVGLDLDLDGRRFLPGQMQARRVFVQAWQLSGNGGLGAFSIPICLAPTGTGLGSMATPGDLCVTEFMKDPSAVSDSHGEWIEVRSNKAWRLDIEGMTISDYSGASFTLDNGGEGILLAPGERFVIGNDLDPASNGWVAVDWQWSGFSLRNSSDEIILHAADGRLLDALTYDDGVRWPDAPGMSISLADPYSSSLANNDPELWCSSTTSIAGGPDTGTPGTTNDACP